MADLGTLNQLLDNWLSRDDVSAGDKTQITLLVASRLNIDLRPAAQQTEVELTNTLGEQHFSLPSDFLIPVALTLIDPDTYELQPVSTRRMFEAQQKPDSGPPAYYTFLGDRIITWPEVSLTEQVTLRLSYLAAMDTPTLSTDTNYVLTSVPHIWHECTMMEAAKFTQDFERLPIHQASYQEALKGFHAQENMRRFQGGPFRVRSPRRRIV